MELFHAANQWATRPDDQRFNDLESMYDATRQYAAVAKEKEIPWSDLRVEATGDDLTLVGRAGVPARPTNYAFRQLASRVGAPAGYLQQLPATLAAQNLNHGLKHNSSGERASLLFHTNGDLLLRAVTSTRYERVWNHEVLYRLMMFSQRHGLVPARQTFSWTGAAVDPNAPAALYASDHDMFAFVMSQDKVLVDPVGKTLRRGVIVINSEVGDKALKFMGFMFRDLCANHIIWGAEQLAEVRLNHVGAVHGRLQDAWLTVRKYMDGAASLDEAAMQQARVKIAGTKDEVLDKLFGIRSLRLSRKVLDASYDAVVPDEDGDPNTVWGMAQGITRHSQTLPYAEERQELDQAAGRLLDFVF